MTVQEILDGNRRALARFLTKVENRRESVQKELAELYPHSADSHIIGVTGAPGTGKSSLVTALVKRFRAREQQVAVVAVDPTSPFSGGAILGDRIRMRDLSGDKGVYIRSMATRGNLGGLSVATQDVARVLSAAGYDIVIVETVGAGQSEVDIVRLAHTTLVIEAPNLGDGVQAIKAGILETADVLVVNKCDVPGAEKTKRALKVMLDLGHPTKQQVSGNDMWIPPIVSTSTVTDEGLDELVDKVIAHHLYLQQGDTQQNLRHEQMREEFYRRLQVSLFKRFVATIDEDMIAGIINRMTQYDVEPQQGVDELLADVMFTDVHD